MQRRIRPENSRLCTISCHNFFQHIPSSLTNRRGERGGSNARENFQSESLRRNPASKGIQARAWLLFDGLEIEGQASLFRAKTLGGKGGVEGGMGVDFGHLWNGLCDCVLLF